MNMTTRERSVPFRSSSSPSKTCFSLYSIYRQPWSRRAANSSRHRFSFRWPRFVLAPCCPDSSAHLLSRRLSPLVQSYLCKWEIVPVATARAALPQPRSTTSCGGTSNSSSRSEKFFCLVRFGSFPLAQSCLDIFISFLKYVLLVGLRLSVHLFILGPGESGKSTIFKQMKIIQDNGGFSRDELMGFKHVVQANCISQMRVLVQVRPAAHSLLASSSSSSILS